jgi:threonine/homoserine/homoserine lactone efflux protein
MGRRGREPCDGLGLRTARSARDGTVFANHRRYITSGAGAVPIRHIILGSLIGLFSGLVPGPFSALIVTTALRSGFWAGFRIALVPLATETAVMAMTTLFVSRLPDGALRWLGAAGGLFLLYLAKRTWDLARRPSAADSEGEDEPGRSMLRAAAVAIVSPSPWAFWLLVGAPFLLGAWRQGWTSGAAFVGSLLLCLVGVHVTVAAVAGRGHHRLSTAWRQRLLLAAAAGLVLAAGAFLWQSVSGDFRGMMGADALRSAVGDSTS